MMSCVDATIAHVRFAWSRGGLWTVATRIRRGEGEGKGERERDRGSAVRETESKKINERGRRGIPV